MITTKKSSFPTVKVLVVDDRSENLIAMQATFKDCGYEVYESLSGTEALELVKNHDFACILLDVQMPVMDGFETAIWIRREPRSKTTPIIFATAIHRSEEHEELGYIAGAVDYLFKPINTFILKAKVSVFVELYLQSEEIKKKNILLEDAILRSRENEQLKEALTARDEFLMMASHELKTPITPLRLQLETFIQIFENGSFADLDPARLLRMLRTSHGQVERLSRLVNELLDVSRLSSHKIQLNVASVDLFQLTKKVINEFNDEITKSGCVINLVHSDEVVGHWDGFRMEQVIINLLINALKYGSGKPIEISVLAPASGTARFVIRDHGIGIAPEDFARIFERYERAVSSKNYGGLGLGLYISQEIIRLHNGRIWVESGEGCGAVFAFDMPLHRID